MLGSILGYPSFGKLPYNDHFLGRLGMINLYWIDRKLYVDVV